MLLGAISLNTIHLSGLTFGQGLPKICVPLTSSTLPALLQEARQAQSLSADLVEWRLDAFSGDPLPALSSLCQGLALPLLCTLRTAGQGGEARLEPREYQAALTRLIQAGGFAFIDIEMGFGSIAASLAAQAKKAGLGVIISSHDFQKTPPKEQMVRALEEMRSLGAHLPKLAVTPQSPQDVLALLQATLEASQRLGPVVTMSMGELGRLSRVSGGLTGSCITFGAGQNASAPGQLPANRLKTLLVELGGAQP